MKKSHQIKDILQIDVSEAKLTAWQEIVDTMADIMGIPAGLIIRLNDPDIEVLVSSKGQDNPCHPGDREKVWGSGLYCDTVLKSRDKLLVPNAFADENWKNDPDIKLQMISYMGFPILLPDGSAFGTICVLDKEAYIQKHSEASFSHGICQECAEKYYPGMDL